MVTNQWMKPIKEILDWFKKSAKGSLTDVLLLTVDEEN